MSKSKGNVIDPLELIDDYGADALDSPSPPWRRRARHQARAGSVEGYRNFATKLWNAARFAEINGCVPRPGFRSGAAKATLNRWIAGESERTPPPSPRRSRATASTRRPAPSTISSGMSICDWYLELIKPILTGADGAAKAETRAGRLRARPDRSTLLHPFMPFVTEELWAGAPRRGPGAIVSWCSRPGRRPGLRRRAADAEIGWLIELIAEVRSVRVGDERAGRRPWCRWSSQARARRPRARCLTHEEAIGAWPGSIVIDRRQPPTAPFNRRREATLRAAACRHRRSRAEQAGSSARLEGGLGDRPRLRPSSNDKFVGGRPKRWSRNNANGWPRRSCFASGPGPRWVGSLPSPHRQPDWTEQGRRPGQLGRGPGPHTPVRDDRRRTRGFAGDGAARSNCQAGDLLGNVGDVLVLRIFGEQMIERLILRGPDVLGN